MVQRMQAAELSVIHFVPLRLYRCCCHRRAATCMSCQLQLDICAEYNVEVPRAVGGSVANSCSDSHMQVLESPL